MAEQRSIDNIIRGMYPNIKQQQRGVQQFIQQAAQRQGTAGAFRRSMEAVAPYAQEAADKAGSLATTAASMDEQKRQFEANLAQRQKEFEAQQKLREGQFDIGKLIRAYNLTGKLTPEMLDVLGYGGLGGMDMRNVERQLKELGIELPGMGSKSHLLYGGGNVQAGTKEVDGVRYGPRHPMLQYV